MKHIGGKLELTRDYSPKQILIEIVYDGKTLENRFIMNTDQKISEIFQRISEIVNESPLMCFVEGEDGRLEMFGARIRMDDSIGVYSKYFKDRTRVFVHGNNLPRLEDYMDEKLIPNPTDLFVPKKNPDVGLVIKYEGRDILIGKEIAKRIRTFETDQQRKILIINLRRILSMYVPKENAKLYAYVVFITLTVFGKRTLDLSNNPMTPVEMGRVREMFGEENVPYGSLFKLFGVKFASSERIVRRTIEWQLFEDELMGLGINGFLARRPPENVSQSVLKRSILIMNKKLRSPGIETDDDEPELTEIPERSLAITAITWIEESPTVSFANFLLDFCKNRYYNEIAEVFHRLKQSTIWTQELFNDEAFILTFTRALDVIWYPIAGDLPPVIYERYVTTPILNVRRKNLDTMRSRFNALNPEEATGKRIFESYLIDDRTTYAYANELFLTVIELPHFMTNISDVDLMGFFGVLDIQAYLLAYQMIDYYWEHETLHPRVTEIIDGNAELLQFITRFSDMF